MIWSFVEEFLYKTSSKRDKTKNDARKGLDIKSRLNEYMFDEKLIGFQILRLQNNEAFMVLVSVSFIFELHFGWEIINFFTK